MGMGRKVVHTVILHLSLLRIAFISSLFLRSARLLLSDTTAHMAAGSQPISVICSIRQAMPDNIFPRSRKESQGNRMAIRVILEGLAVFSFFP